MYKSIMTFYRYLAGNKDAAERLLQQIIRKLWYLLAAGIILAALMVSLARLLTPVLNDHRADFEKLASRLLDMPVMIRTVNLAWHGYAPRISLRDVTVLDSETQKPKLAMQRFELDFSIWRSVWERQAYISNITLSGLQLTVTHEPSGQVQIGEFASLNIKDKLTGSSVQADKIVSWIFSQPKLQLENIDLTYIGPDQPQRSITLKALTLRNSATQHALDGKATLNQELPVNAKVHIDWDGDVLHMPDAKGHFYAYLEGISLPQWFSKMTEYGLQIKQGVGSAKIWGSWEKSQLQTLQSTFRIYDLELNAVAEKHIEIIDSISGNVGWKREGNSQVFAADQLFINLPYHLWPETGFEIRVTPNAEGKFILNSAEIVYLDVNDATRFLLLTESILSDALRQQLTALDPKGEIKNFKADLFGPVTSVAQLKIATEFAGLSVNPKDNYPGLNNFSGKLTWDGKIGTLNLDSENIFFSMPQLFMKPIFMKSIVGETAFSLNETGIWNFQTKKLVLANEDLNITLALALTLPITESPTIDLTADFALIDAAHISAYLPVKTFDPDFKDWLYQAFHKGHAEAGKVVVQGKLADFPFDKQNGKFLVSAQVKDTDLSFAPGWPLITNIQGVLTFAGHEMTADVATGKILDIPIKNVRAMIPYIGEDAPQFLNVNEASLSGDLRQGMNFIHASPLQQKFGKYLEGIDLTGPMQLKLTLSVPVKRPKETKVFGEVTMTNAVLNVPDWKLSLNKVNGGFQFTQLGIEAKDIKGELFNTTATLNLTTLQEKSNPGLVRADLVSHIKVSQLEEWLKVSVAPVVKGEADYVAQLFLSPHQESQTSHIVISSDLSGVSVNIPEGYGKKAEDSAEFKIDLAVNNSKLLKAKLDYAKKISMAMNLEKTLQGFRLLGGELRLGGGDANWTSGSGFYIRGQMQKIDWNVWQQYFASLKIDTKPTSKNQIDMLKGIDLNAGIIDVMGQEFHQASVQVSTTQNNWNIQMNSNEVTGDIVLPMNHTNQTIVGHFQRINLDAPNARRTQGTINPRTLPPLSIDCKEVRFNGLTIGHVYLSTSPNAQGLNIRELSINQPSLKLEASGEWYASGSRGRSHLQGILSSSRISDVLKNWGVGSNNFVGSTGEVKFNLNWADAPYRLTLGSLTGDFSIQLGKGRIVELSESSDAKMGLGRLLNIFSLSSIPRRLSFDFSDLFEKGYSFDNMKGTFNLRSGSAFTEDMSFNGPIARVDIRGRVGLQAKDFDMQLGVTPYVTSSLPVVAAIAGGPIAGVATWMVDKVISGQMSRVTTYQYSVTGSWSNPVWSERGSTPAPVQAPVSTR